MEEARLIPTIMGRRQLVLVGASITRRIQPFHRE
jgi:hypothetical protein